MLFLRRFPVASLLIFCRPYGSSVTSTSSVGIIDLIFSEHQYMRDEYEQLKTIENTKELDSRARQWIAYIALHGHKEEIAFYPKVEKYLKDEQKGGHHLIEHGIKEHRQLEKELKKLAEQSTVTWKQIHKSADKLMHHLKEEENDILEPLRSKLDDKFQLVLAQQFNDAGRLASDKPHPELSRKPEKAPQDNIDVGLAEKQKDL
ncbi:unnamed protein product [Adineta ricciae]|uniref:Hemerythrin-like domain-containing protein n=1 Tax=Adineta ricciae TaxID=249248 RepID=A0A814DPM8_ADIRI|nr:unnamed protein product [Adineta ricciae]CAF1566240.1 unnamed protein product [Adineta ricciae]